MKNQSKKPNKKKSLSKLSFVLSIISFLADVAATASFFTVLSGQKIYLNPSLSFAALILFLVGIMYGLTRATLTYYQKKAVQTKSKLLERESDFFQIIESDITNILAEKVHNGGPPTTNH